MVKKVLCCCIGYGLPHPPFLPSFSVTEKANMISQKSIFFVNIHLESIQLLSKTWLTLDFLLYTPRNKFSVKLEQKYWKNLDSPENWLLS